MPISNDVFDSASISSNPKLLEFFMKNKDKAYVVKELQPQFGSLVGLDLLTLVWSGHLESKFIGNDVYYRLKQKR